MLEDCATKAMHQISRPSKCPNMTTTWRFRSLYHELSWHNLKIDSTLIHLMVDWLSNVLIIIEPVDREGRI